MFSWPRKAKKTKKREPVPVAASPGGNRHAGGQSPPDRLSRAGDRGRVEHGGAGEEALGSRCKRVGTDGPPKGVAQHPMISPAEPTDVAIPMGSRDGLGCARKG